MSTLIKPANSQLAFAVDTKGGSLIVQLDKLGRVEGFMPRSEQIPGEQFRPGDRVRCFILDVRDTGSQVKIVLSRSHPDFHSTFI